MRTNNTSVIEYIKLISTLPTVWLDNPSLLGRFGSFKENVTQTITNLTSLKKAYCLLIKSNKIFQIKKQQKWCKTITDLVRFPRLAKYFRK